MIYRSLNETAFSVDLAWLEVYKTPARETGHFLSPTKRAMDSIPSSRRTALQTPAGAMTQDNVRRNPQRVGRLSGILG